MKKSFSLKFKLILYTLIITSFSVFSVGYISNHYLQKNFATVVKNDFKEAFLNIATKLQDTEKNILESVDLISQNKEIIASMNLINRYQDINNYDSMIFDEEKKRIIKILLQESKYSLSDHISIYDTKDRLVAFSNHTKKTNLTAYTSYKNAKPLYYSKQLNELKYVQQALPKNIEAQLYNTTRLASYEIEDGGISYQRHKDTFVIKAKSAIVQLLPNKKREFLGYVRTKKYFSITTLESFINSNLLIDFDFIDKRVFFDTLQDTPLLFSEFAASNLHLQEEGKDFLTKSHIPIGDGLLILKLKMDKRTLETALKENKTTLILLLVLMTIFIVTTSLFVLDKWLSTPLNKLLEGIKIISKGNYKKSIDLDSQDEIGLISEQINKMSKEISKRETELDNLAHYDSLTKIPNRIMFKETLDKSISRAERLEKKLAIFFLDLDDFKNINDSLGHHIGDRLLIEVSKNLSAAMRDNDTLSRIGGDEFNILIEDLDSISNLAEIAQKYLSQIQVPINIDGNIIHISGSIGISIYPHDGTDSATLLKNADLAMYKAKDNGRNQHSFFSAELERSLTARIKMLAQLKNAINRDELRLHYQPKFSLADGSIYAAEALIRWESPELGLIMPDEFIPLAEDSKYIVEIGEWVIKQACKDFASWGKLGLNIKQLSVNVSKVQFENSNVVKILSDNIDANGISADSLEVEITESYMQGDTEQAIEILQEIRALGVELAIDDFGTGYSSMSYLKKLPINRLKIDRSFINDIPYDSDDVEITKIIISLAKIMKLSVTAEGVETLEQMHFLQKLGAEEGQGYICSKPLPYEQFVELLKNTPNCIV